MTPAEELALIGNQKQTATILGKKFVLRTLDSDEEAAASVASSIFDASTRDRVLQIEKLARAIETIDGVPFSVTEEEKTKGLTALSNARKMVFKWQPPVVKRVYAEYEKLELSRESAVAEIEKNAPSPTTSSGAGR